MQINDYEKLLRAAKNWSISADDEALIDAIRAMEVKLTLWKDSSKASNEVYAVCSKDQAGNVGMYLRPVLERIHAISPETPMSLTFGETDSVLTVELKTAGRRPVVASDTTAQSILARCEPFLRLFANANRDESGECLQCGSATQSGCSADCPTLEAELLLSLLITRSVS